MLEITVLRMKKILQLWLFLFIMAICPSPVKSQGTAQTSFDSGNTYLFSTNYDQAINLFLAAISVNPNYSEAYIELGVAYRRKGDLDRAIINLQKGITLRTSMVDQTYLARGYANLGQAYLEGSDFAQAYRYINQAVTADNNSQEAYNAMGLYYLSTKSYDKAISYFNDALARTPYFVDNYTDNIYYNIATAYKANGDYGNAREYLQKALDISRNKNNLEKFRKALAEIESHN